MDNLHLLFINSNTIMDINDNVYPNPWMMLLMGPIFQQLGSILLEPFIPDYLETPLETSRRFQWRTTFLARIAAAVTGVAAVIVLHQSPHLQSDLMFGSSAVAVNLIIFSLGVHIGEMMDMVIHGQFSLFTIHHLAVIACFTGAILNNKAIGFAVLTLVTELNAVTNKTRSLHVISNCDITSLKYKINAYINFVTFFIRILVIFWMNDESIHFFVQEPSLFGGCCTLSLLFVNMWNLTVFKTLFVRDILQKPKDQ